MPHQFEKHYTREEASALLPNVRMWFGRLRDLRHSTARLEKRLTSLAPEGSDTGGTAVNEWVRQAAEVRSLFYEFFRREIQIKDLDRGLIDFPAILNGREVFLCWEMGEDDIGFWHDLDAGYAGREPL